MEAVEAGACSAGIAGCAFESFLLLTFAFDDCRDFFCAPLANPEQASIMSASASEVAFLFLMR
jgi:hypothetical protein